MVAYDTVLTYHLPEDGEAQAMLGSDTLEVGIGLALIFLFLSLACSGIRETIEAWMRSRSGDLERGMRELLNDPGGEGLAKQFFNHPIISALFPGNYDPKKLSGDDGAKAMPRSARKDLPSYIPACNFSQTMIDILHRGEVGKPVAATAFQELSLPSLRASALVLPDTKVQRAILSAIDNAQGDLDKFRANLESWFDSSMDRVSGWYKKRTQWILFWIGLVAAVLLNVDAVAIVKQLTKDKTLRQAVITQAQSLTDAAKNNSDVLKQLQEKSYNQIKGQIEDIGYPIGWPMPQAKLACENTLAATAKPGAKLSETEKKAVDKCKGTLSFCDQFFVLGGNLIQVLLGWLISAFAVTLGAPFWFDILNKFMTLRTSIKPPAKPVDGSTDQTGAPTSTTMVKTTSNLTALPIPPAVLAFEPNNWVVNTLSGKTDPNEGLA